MTSQASGIQRVNRCLNGIRSSGLAVVAVGLTSSHQKPASGPAQVSYYRTEISTTPRNIHHRLSRCHQYLNGP
jgi:hypothetical protein